LPGGRVGRLGLFAVAGGPDELGAAAVAAASRSLPGAVVPGDALLLPDACLSHRRYVAEVIGGALLSIGREGYRRAGERLGVPGETVRDWRRRFGSRAQPIASHFLRWVRALDATFDPPAGHGSQVADAIEAIGRCTRVASLRFGRRWPWSWASALTAGGLLAVYTCTPWPVPE
jgi:hypothetical protein